MMAASLSLSRGWHLVRRSLQRQRKDEGAAANPVASLGRNAAATGDGSFFSDPTTAICGPVIFVGAEGEDITLDEIERIKDGIRAARNYRDDYPEEFNLWRNAVYNLRTA